MIPSFLNIISEKSIVPDERTSVLRATDRTTHVQGAISTLWYNDGGEGVKSPPAYNTYTL